MDTWEYKQETHDFARFHRPLIEELREAGAEGWLLVAVIPANADLTTVPTLFLIYARKVAKERGE